MRDDYELGEWVNPMIPLNLSLRFEPLMVLPFRSRQHKDNKDTYCADKNYACAAGSLFLISRVLNSGHTRHVEKKFSSPIKPRDYNALNDSGDLERAT